MQNIGERLEEARKKQGVSIREASEATKIRGEFLLAFENGSMDIPLPEVYVRGFLINYAKFLKLDPDLIMTDYDALMLGRGKGSKKESREYLGRIDIPETTGATEPSVPAAGRENGDRALYLKVGLAFGAAVLVIALIVLLVNVVVSTGSDTPELNPELNPTADAAKPLDSPAPPAEPIEEEITLVALGDVAVTVTQLSDNTRIFTGRLTTGEKRTIKKTGAIRIGYSEGDNLVVEKDGQRYKMGKSNVGSSTLD